MDSQVRAEGHRSNPQASIARRLRLLALVVSTAVATACGGGSGGDGNGNGGTPTGQIAASVEDQFGAPVSGVTITATVNNTTRTAQTGDDGTATVTQVPTGSVTVTATDEDVIEPPPQTVTLAEDETENVAFTIERVVEAAGGISQAVAEGPTDGSTFSFRLRVIVLDQNFNPVPGLTASAFTLEDCTQVRPEFPEKPNCVRGAGREFDADYTVADPPNPTAFAPRAAPGPFPYAAGLLFDSSESIANTDETDARIFATKEFLGDVGSGDLVMLAAFADDVDALLPFQPLTFFPCEAATPCTPAFTSDGNSLFASLDELATLEEGGTPLYDALATEDGLTGIIINVDDTAPTTPADLRKAVVLFSDGRDIYCDPADGSGSFFDCTQRRIQVVAEAESRLVNIFTIGLSNQVDSLAMAELALRNGGAYLFAERPAQLLSIFGALDPMLSDSLPSYEMVWTVDAAVAGSFAPGSDTCNPDCSLIGRLTVDTGSASFTLPFVVTIE